MGYERRPVPGFSNYEADTDGRIWKLSGPSAGMLVGTFPRNPHRRADYWVVCVWDDTGTRHRRHKLHRLICAAFHGPAPVDRPIARHIDDNRDNNRPDNLAWGSNADNSDDMRKNGRSRPGETNPSAKLTNAQVIEMVERHWAGERAAMLAKEYRISTVAFYNWKRKVAERAPPNT